MARVAPAMPAIPRLSFKLELNNPAAFEDIEYDRLIQALRQGALMAGEWTRGLWIRVAQGLDVRRTGAYIRGIQDGTVQIVSENVTDNDTATNLEIVVEVVNTAPHASYVEEGHSAFHLPSVINWGSTSGRIKRDSKGRPYLNIAFRHSAYAGPEARESQGLTRGTIKAMMPEEIYGKAKRLNYTQSLGVGPVRTPSGQWVAADRYKWGRRLDRSGTSPAFIFGPPGGEAGHEEHRGARVVGKDRGGNPLINPAWGSSKYHGLFKSGSRGHSSYMTIRTITPTSPGWNIPAQEGLYIADRVARAAGSSADLQEIVMGAMMGVLEGG